MNQKNCRILVVVACVAVASLVALSTLRGTKDVYQLQDHKTVMSSYHAKEGSKETNPIRQAAEGSKETNPIPQAADLDKMSESALSDLFYGYLASTQVTCSRVLRMGKIGDGGWDICDEPRYKMDHTNCLVYSYGIDYEFSYDDDMEKYGCEVHSFDPSMTKSKDHIRGKKVHFHLTGIGGSDTKTSKGWSLYTLGTQRQRLGHEPSKRRVDIVKMDVERAELAALPKAIKEGSLNDLKQLSFEIHMRNNRATMLEFLTIFRNLWDLGFRLYFTTRNVKPVNFFKDRNGKLQTLCHELNMININNKNY